MQFSLVWGAELFRPAERNMCLRNVNYCKGCSRCFTIPKYTRTERICNIGCSALCCSRPSEKNIVVDRLCCDPGCFRRTEEGARIYRGVFPFRNRCHSACQAQTCQVQVFFLPCITCYGHDPVIQHAEKLKYWRPSARRVEPNAIPLDPHLASRPSQRWVSQSLAATLAENMERGRDGSDQSVNSEPSPQQ
jgi:hypothetical protein